MSWSSGITCQRTSSISPTVVVAGSSLALLVSLLVNQGQTSNLPMARPFLLLFLLPTLRSLQWGKNSFETVIPNLPLLFIAACRSIFSRTSSPSPVFALFSGRLWHFIHVNLVITISFSAYEIIIVSHALAWPMQNWFDYPQQCRPNHLWLCLCWAGRSSTLDRC